MYSWQYIDVDAAVQRRCMSSRGEVEKAGNLLGELLGKSRCIAMVVQF
jgi:hypothetical protein